MVQSCLSIETNSPYIPSAIYSNQISDRSPESSFSSQLVEYCASVAEKVRKLQKVQVVSHNISHTFTWVELVRLTLLQNVSLLQTSIYDSINGLRYSSRHYFASRG